MIKHNLHVSIATNTMCSHSQSKVIILKKILKEFCQIWWECPNPIIQLAYAVHLYVYMYFSLLKSKTNKTDVYIYVRVYTVRMHVLYVNYFIFLSFVFFSKCKWLNKAMKSQIPSVCTHTLNSWLWFRFFSPYNRAALAYTRTSGILRKFTACVRLHLWFSLCICIPVPWFWIKWEKRMLLWLKSRRSLQIRLWCPARTRWFGAMRWRFVFSMRWSDTNPWVREANVSLLLCQLLGVRFSRCH